MENIIIKNNDKNLRKVSRGRQKVEMVKMTNETNLQVTFSKRRAGLFKKASELCTLCDAEMALVVFTPGRKVFSFGHPSIEAVLERYTNNRHLLPDPLNGFTSGSDVGSGKSNGGGVRFNVGNGALQLIKAYRNTKLGELNVQLAQVMRQLDTEKKSGEEMTKLRKANQVRCWWEKPIHMLDIEQLGKLKRILMELKKVVHQQAERIMIQASAAINNASPPPIPHRPSLLPPQHQQPQFYPVTSVGSGPHGRSSGVRVHYNNNNNMNNDGFGCAAIIPYSGYVNNNNNDNHGGMMINIPPPSSAAQQGPRGYNSVGYGSRGFYR